MNVSHCLSSPWPGSAKLNGRMNVCPLCGPGLIPSHGGVFQRIFPWLIMLCQPVLSQGSRKWLNLPSSGTAHRVDIEKEGLLWPVLEPPVLEESLLYLVWITMWCPNRKSNQESLILNPIRYPLIYDFISSKVLCGDTCACLLLQDNNDWKYM